MKNSEVVGKYVIIKNLNLKEYMKDENGKICVYDTFDVAAIICDMYEFEDVLIMKIEYNHNPYPLN